MPLAGGRRALARPVLADESRLPLACAASHCSSALPDRLWRSSQTCRKSARQETVSISGIPKGGGYISSLGCGGGIA